MSIELRANEVERVFAWVIIEADPHHLLACFHEGKDGKLHMQYRLATREDPSQEGMDRRKTFSRGSKPMPETEAEVRRHIAEFAMFMAKEMEAELPVILAVESDVKAAWELLGKHPGVDFMPVH